MPVWSRKLRNPIALKYGKSLETLADLRAFILELGPHDREAAWWQYTAELLLKAANSGRMKDVQEAADQFGRALSRTRL